HAVTLVALEGLAQGLEGRLRREPVVAVRARGGADVVDGASGGLVVRGPARLGVARLSALAGVAGAVAAEVVLPVDPAITVVVDAVVAFGDDARVGFGTRIRGRRGRRLWVGRGLG